MEVQPGRHLILQNPEGISTTHHHHTAPSPYWSDPGIQLVEPTCRNHFKAHSFNFFITSHLLAGNNESRNWSSKASQTLGACPMSHLTGSHLGWELMSCGILTLRCVQYVTLASRFRNSWEQILFTTYWRPCRDPQVGSSSFSPVHLFET